MTGVQTNDHGAMNGLQVIPVTGLPEFRPGDNLVAHIAQRASFLVDDDIVVITSKIVSKAEGRIVDVPGDTDEREAIRHQLVEQETVRVVAQRVIPSSQRIGSASSKPLLE